MMQLLDIEGVICPASFVHGRLLPWARERLASFVCERHRDPAVGAALAKVGAWSGAGTLAEQVAVLEMWMDTDVKVQPLKALLDLIWDDGWAAGAFVTPVYPDVPAALQRWTRGGDRVVVYASGSVAAHRQLFAHTVAGDLRPFISAWFDSSHGPKRDPDSYALIAEELGYFPEQIAFWSDSVAELDAAAQIGVATRLVQRDEDACSLSHHPVALDLVRPPVAARPLRRRAGGVSAGGALATR